VPASARIAPAASTPRPGTPGRAGFFRPLRSLGALARFALWGVLAAHVLLAAGVLAAGLALLKTNPRITALMAWREVTAGVKPTPLRWVPLASVPRPARDMVVRLEDRRFWIHRGIDLGAIREAYHYNQSLGYALYGGSTITQQLARNLFLTPRKTYLRKYVEALTALGLDLVLPKARILELYLNVIEWGRGTYGIGAASVRYYGVRPAGLTLDQQRRLIAVISNPLVYSVYKLGTSGQMTSRYDYLLRYYPDPAPAVAPVAPAEAPAPPPAGESPLEEVVPAPEARAP
jgi:monofunctional biosynthetic peptidoglycan transglycosylase